MTKSKNGMVTRNIAYLTTDKFPMKVIESKFSLLPLGRYLLPLIILNRYLPNGSSSNFIEIASSKNVTIARHRISDIWTLSVFIQFSDSAKVNLEKKHSIVAVHRSIILFKVLPLLFNGLDIISA